MRGIQQCLAVCAALASGGVMAAAPDVSAIQPVKGLVMTTTAVNAGLVAAGAGDVHSYSGLDMELWDSVADVTNDEVVYQIRLSTPANASADADAKKFTFRRRVRRDDIAQSFRINWGLSSLDPEMFAGQTYAETSVKALDALKAGGDVPFVIGVLDGSDPSGIGNYLKLASDALASGGSSPLKGLAGLQGANLAHTYYRGTLRRVERTPITLPVLLDGVRLSVPVIHAQGTVMSPANRSLQLQFWWLDSPTWPVALKKSFADAQHVMTEQVTRIDRPPLERPGAGANGDKQPDLAEQLRKSCRAELSGIYFNTGSARLLDESRPALQAVARLVKEPRQSALVIAGHTDNVGSADFNQALSEKRAAAVREALVSQFGVPADRLTTKGFGFTHPLESNDTVEGRARNRRVELVCAGGH